MTLVTDTNDEKGFIETLLTMDSQYKKLIFAMRRGNGIGNPQAEVIVLPTRSGLQWAVSEINAMNQKGSGRYTDDPETAYLWTLDVEKRRQYGNAFQWFLVRAEPHTIDTHYGED